MMQSPVCPGAGHTGAPGQERDKRVRTRPSPGRAGIFNCLKGVFKPMSNPPPPVGARAQQRGEEAQLRHPKCWVQIPSLLITNRASCSRCLHLHNPQSPHLLNGHSNSPWLKGVLATPGNVHLMSKCHWEPRWEHFPPGFERWIWPAPANLSPRARFEFYLLDMYHLAVPLYPPVSLPASLNPPGECGRVGAQPPVPGTRGSASPVAPPSLQRSPLSLYPGLGPAAALTRHLNLPF
ncbi:hypothetical protein HJG60_008799 [Phyllostomus discolor]|uniref:Uncharacterized protein n=1 Tax=Phyllostomus discolor TaxID=89673 RepID=A0A833YTD6_9CHIR|nr:hypothetical protein HJG60_008799 [Phyllostomus discolor]